MPGKKRPRCWAGEVPGCLGLGCGCRTPDGHTAVLLPPRGVGTPALGHTKAVLLPQAPRATACPGAPCPTGPELGPQGHPVPSPRVRGDAEPLGGRLAAPSWSPPCLQQAPCPGGERVSIDPPPASSFYRVRGTELEGSTGFTFHLSTGSSCSSQRINQRIGQELMLMKQQQRGARGVQEPSCSTRC